MSLEEKTSEAEGKKKKLTKEEKERLIEEEVEKARYYDSIGMI